MYLESITKIVLENCLQVTISPNTTARTLNIGLFINHGVKDEDSSINGISHFIEHLSFNYNNLYEDTRKKLGQLMDKGALYEAFTGKEMTRCTLSAQEQCLPEMIDTLCSIITECNVNREVVEHERAIIMQEADTYFSSGRVKEELVEQALWGNRSLGLFVIGNRNNIASFTENQIQERFTKFYTPKNTHLIIQGNVETDQVMDLIIKASKRFTNYLDYNRDVFVEIEPSIVGIGKSDRVDFTVSFVGASFHSRERHAMYLLSDILGNGLKSRLFTELREKRELAYTVFSYAQSYSLSGYIAINVNCQKNKMDEVYRCIISILEDIKANGVSEEELQRVKAARVTNMLQLFGNTSKHLQITGRYSLLHKDFFIDLELYEIRTVSCDDIKNLAKSMFIDDRMALSALGASSDELSILL
ncbi:M16 family metallopeptidase [Brevibacillus daliensis]|uniref:M16 family metallopeptidase n=1 Tax=Brevibacillus daliensis TaxID=2892995 RepID=UPI001E3EE3F4|nr:pitrilysin family protein [Brevibacillus daliensis]